MILVIVDAYSKYIDAHVLTSATTASTILRLRQTFSTHGVPCTIVSDNGSPLTSLEFQQYCSMNGIKHIRSSPFHPATNGLAERSVQTIKRGLKKMGGDLETRMFEFLGRYRITPQTTTGESPAQMLISKTPRFRLDLVRPRRENRVLHQQEKAQESHNSAVPEQIFYLGDTVWAMNFAAAAPKWLPGVLQHCLGPVSFTVGLTDGRVWRRHIDHIWARLPEENVTTTSPRPPEGFVPPARAVLPAREDIAEAATAKSPPDLSSNEFAIVNDVPSSTASEVVVPELRRSTKFVQPIIRFDL